MVNQGIMCKNTHLCIRKLQNDMSFIVLVLFLLLVCVLTGQLDYLRHISGE